MRRTNVNTIHHSGKWHNKFDDMPLNGWHTMQYTDCMTYCHFKDGKLHNEYSFSVMSVSHADKEIKFGYDFNGERLAFNISPQEWKEMIFQHQLIEIIET